MDRLDSSRAPYLFSAGDVAVRPSGGVWATLPGRPLLTRLSSSPWLAFLLRRLLSLAVILVALLFAAFIMVRLIPGDPAEQVGGLSATPEQLQAIRHDLGIDEPFGVQLVNYLEGIAQGNLGMSFQTREPVIQVVQERIGNSLQLASVSLLLVLLLAIPGGMLAGALTREGRHRNGEVAFTAVTSIVGSIPEYLAGTFLAFLFAVWLRLLPVAGAEGWQSLVLPALAISLRPIAFLTRIVRVETLNVLAQDYMRTARSKRLPARILYLRHALPNVVTAALTVGGLLFSALTSWSRTSSRGRASAPPW